MIELESLNGVFRSQVEKCLADRTDTEAGRFQGVKDADLRFHRCIRAATRNKHLTEYAGIGTIEFHTFLYGELADPDRSLVRAVQEHRQLIDAIRTGNETAAERVSKRHIAHATSSMEGT